MTRRVRANPHMEERLRGIQQMLVGAHQAGAPMSSATKGIERELFIGLFLSRVLTPQYRFGTGDAIDQSGRRSGQLDVVIEYPLIPSLPIVGVDNPRLYLAEGIAAVIEVKSDITKQWGEVLGTASKLAPLRREYDTGSGALIGIGGTVPERIPIFAVGYTGWKDPTAVQQKLEGVPVDGVLVIDSGIFVGNPVSYDLVCVQPTPLALWALVVCIHKAVSQSYLITGNIPLRYLGVC